MESHIFAHQLCNEIIDNVPVFTNILHYNPDVLSGPLTDISISACLDNRASINVGEAETDLGQNTCSARFTGFTKTTDEEQDAYSASEKSEADKEVEFKAEDIFPDLILSPEIIAVNETTQTSQSLGPYLVDASAQTSQSLIADVFKETETWLKCRSPKADGRKEAHPFEDDQVVPELALQFIPPPSRSSPGKRRLGLSKRARFNPLHKNRF